MEEAYPLDMFKGTAEYYELYRPKYPAELFADIASRFPLDRRKRRGTLLDLGCGTGQLALPLAEYFEEVLAWDPDPGMLELGEQKAAEAGLSSIITFAQKSSRDLGAPGALQRPIRLVTMGQSFHWMEQSTVLGQLLEALEALGGVAIVSATVEIPQNDRDKLALAKRAAVQSVVARFLGSQRLAGSVLYRPEKKSHEVLLEEAGFRRVGRRRYPLKTKLTVGDVVGHTLSTSWASEALLGDRATAFKDELRDELNALSPPGGKFTETIEFSCVTAIKE